MLTIDDARRILRDENVRLKPQRLMIAEVLIGSREHPTVERIHDVILARYPSISLATVYNTATLLARYGLINLLHGGKDGLRLDPDTTPHAHAHCVQCGQVLDVSIQKPAAVNDRDLQGFRETRMEISVFGCCPQCAENGESLL